MDGNLSRDKAIKNRVLSMILPITIENVLQMTTGLVLMAMVGRINSIAVGAIGLATVFYKVIWGIFKGIATGTSVLVAQSYGANNYRKLKSVSEQSFIITLGISIVLQQIIYWNAGFFLKVFNPSPELLSSGEQYLKIISWSLPFAATIILAAGILQGMGNAKTPMIAVGILNIINIIGGYIFIFVVKMGLKGAGYAYNIAYIFASIFVLLMLFGRKGILTSKLGKFHFKFNIKKSLTIIRLGLPTSFETIFGQGASILLSRAILTYGEIPYAAYQLAYQAESISYMPAIGFGIAATTFIGQALGSKNKELGNKYLKQLIKFTIIFTIFAGGVFILVPKQIMGILTNDKEVIVIGAKYLFVMGIVQLPQNLSGVLNGALRGGGYLKAPMISSAIGLWGIRVPFALLMTFVLKVDIIWIWIGIGLDMCFRFIFSYLYYKKKDVMDQDNLIIE